MTSEIQRIYKLTLKFTIGQQKPVTDKPSNQKKNTVGNLFYQYRDIITKLYPLSQCASGRDKLNTGEETDLHTSGKYLMQVALKITEVRMNHLTVLKQLVIYLGEKRKLDPYCITYKKFQRD